LVDGVGKVDGVHLAGGVAVVDGLGEAAGSLIYSEDVRQDGFGGVPRGFE